MSFPSLLCTAFLLLVLSIAASSSDPRAHGLDGPSTAPGPSSAKSSEESLPETPAPASTLDDDDVYGGGQYTDTSPPAPPPSVSPTSEIPDEDSTRPNSSTFVPDSSTSVPIIWCAVRDKIKECKKFVSMLSADSIYSWSCDERDYELDCIEAIQKGDADVMSLDAGMAYVAFMNYQMKAIMMEEYCYFAKSYEAVAVVNKGMCDKNPYLSLKDLKGMKSCHSGYLTAAGWNYPIQYLVESGLQAPSKEASDTQGRDEAVLASFFASTCAPSGLEGHGLCTSCGNNGSCTTDSFAYVGDSGAFRCLIDGTGDITFVRSGTIERLSADGKQLQKWSTKLLDDFRYLCPQGGCRSINENIGNCTFGSVPANVIMTRNSQLNSRRSEMVERLLNASYSGALYNPQNWNDDILSSSAQNLVEVTELTRHVLGASAVVAHTVQTLGENKTETPYFLTTSGSSTLTNQWGFLSLLLMVLYHHVTRQRS